MSILIGNARFSIQLILGKACMPLVSHESRHTANVSFYLSYWSIIICIFNFKKMFQRWNAWGFERCTNCGTGCTDRWFTVGKSSELVLVCFRLSDEKRRFSTGLCLILPWYQIHIYYIQYIQYILLLGEEQCVYIYILTYSRMCFTWNNSQFCDITYYHLAATRLHTWRGPALYIRCSISRWF